MGRYQDANYYRGSLCYRLILFVIWLPNFLDVTAQEVHADHKRTTSLGVLASEPTSGDTGLFEPIEISPAVIPKVPFPTESGPPMYPIPSFPSRYEPVLTGKCPVNFSLPEISEILDRTAFDCAVPLASLVGNVICCPQFSSLIHIVQGLFGRKSNNLVLPNTVADHCFSDVISILASRGANSSLSTLCSIKSSNFTGRSCPVKDHATFERTVNTSKLVEACRTVDPLKECCRPVCQPAIMDATLQISGRQMMINNDDHMAGEMNHTDYLNDCKGVVYSYLSKQLSIEAANKAFRILSACKVNKVCPLTFTEPSDVIAVCQNVAAPSPSCCSSLNTYIAGIQKQMLVTNKQAIICATQFGSMLRGGGVMTNVFELCDVDLKDFSIQAYRQDVGCLHRHFASQTKDLITEIELLEEEVTSREQHVLAMYRNIFEQCVSRPPSEQSSSVASPAHSKQESRKHPSIISSAFCSSKNFPLRPLQALISNNDLKNRIFGSSHAPLSSGKDKVYFGRTCPDSTTKVHEKFSSIEKAPVLRALKDHLHQCPSRLSEEMMKCMATMYCWLRSAKSVNAENSRSPILSRSSTNAIQPRHSIVEDQDCSCKSAVEISWIATRKRHSSHASYAMDNYRILVEQLERVNISQMECDRKIVFWINVHNALVMHAHLAYGIPQSSLRRLALFHKAAYNIGGHIISANTIEQAIFCFRTPRLGRWLESVVSAALRKKSGEERQLINSKFGIIDSQPLVCFALCTGALSDPMLKVYTASNLREELDAAKREFLQANVVVKKSSKVILPKLVERFSREASINIDNILGWMMENVDKKLHDSIQKCIDRKSNKKPSQIIEWRPYSSKFRYMFSKDLIDKL